MNINRILGELNAERDRIDRAIAAIESLNSAEPRRIGRPPGAVGEGEAGRQPHCFFPPRMAFAKPHGGVSGGALSRW